MKNALKNLAGIVRNAFSAVARRVHIAMGVAQSIAAGITGTAMKAADIARLFTRAGDGRRIVARAIVLAAVLCVGLTGCTYYHAQKGGGLLYKAIEADNAGDYQRARALYEESFEQTKKSGGNPGNASIALNRIGILYHLGRGVQQSYETAASWYEAALTWKPSSAIRENIADVREEGIRKFPRTATGTSRANVFVEWGIPTQVFTPDEDLELLLYEFGPGRSETTTQSSRQYGGGSQSTSHTLYGVTFGNTTQDTTYGTTTTSTEVQANSCRVTITMQDEVVVKVDRAGDWCDNCDDTEGEGCTLTDGGEWIS